MESEQVLTSEKQEPERDRNGRLLPGNTANPNGRPKGKFSLKTMIIRKLEENPDTLEDVIDHLINNERALLFQMIDGRPSQQTDITTKGRAINTLKDLPDDELINIADGSEEGISEEGAGEETPN
jgi:hypothetical protein